VATAIRILNQREWKIPCLAGSKGGEGYLDTGGGASLGREFSLPCKQSGAEDQKRRTMESTLRKEASIGGGGAGKTEAAQCVWK